MEVALSAFPVRLSFYVNCSVNLLFRTWCFDVSLEKPLFDDSDSEIEYQYHSTVDNITESSFTKCDLIFKKENELVCLSLNKETEFIAVLPSLITTPIIKRCASWEELKTFSEASNSDVPKEDLRPRRSNDFVNLLNTLQLDDIGNYIKTDKIILMIGSRSYSALKRKKDKVSETKKLVRSRMRLTARLYLSFKSIYNNQKAVKLDNILNNAADKYCREVITIVGEAINSLSEKSNEDLDHLLLSAQKSGLKISILNLLKLTAKFLIGYFLVKNDDLKSQRVVDFLKVLNLYEDDLFGDAYYNLNYRKNIDLQKPINLPNEDVQLLIEECNKIMNSIDDFQHPCESFVTIRSATATCLTIFNARRGGEPVRLHLFLWNEALNKQNLPEEFDIEQMFITYQTGKVQITQFLFFFHQNA
nr:uncharacterized protein LOC124817083 [Hydra vulgaris]